jgi:AcrR family transcriptional regulator
MLLNGTEDLRVQKTIEAIHKTFEEMICEMDYEKITVKELCERARINKKTFYRYYDVLDDLLSELQNIMTREYLERIANYRIPEELDKINREFFLYSIEKGLVYEKITCSGSYNYIRNKMVNNVISSTWGKSTWLQLLDTYKQNILLGFVQSASVEMYRRWVSDGKKIPLEEIIEISNQLLCAGVNGFVEHNMPL